MGASIYWQPVHGTHLDVGGLRSAFVEMFSQAFGASPWTLDARHMERLEGMVAAVQEPTTKAALSYLIDAIATHGTIRIWPEY